MMDTSSFPYMEILNQKCITYTLYVENKISQVNMLQKKTSFLNTNKNIYVQYYWVKLKFS